MVDITKKLGSENKSERLLTISTVSCVSMGLSGEHEHEWFPFTCAKYKRTQTFHKGSQGI